MDITRHTDGSPALVSITEDAVDEQGARAQFSLIIELTEADTATARQRIEHAADVFGIAIDGEAEELYERAITEPLFIDHFILGWN